MAQMVQTYHQNTFSDALIVKLHFSWCTADILKDCTPGDRLVTQAKFNPDHLIVR